MPFSRLLMPTTLVQRGSSVQSGTSVAGVSETFRNPSSWNRPASPCVRILEARTGNGESKLTWLALGDDHEGLFSRVEQLTALLRSVKP